MATTEGATSKTLVRALRRRDLAGILLNAMIGAGMLAAPAKVYAIAGNWSFAVLAASAVILIPLILCFADLGSRFSGTGGPYLYARQALSPLLAFAVGNAGLNLLSGSRLGLGLGTLATCAYMCALSLLMGSFDNRLRK